MTERLVFYSQCLLFGLAIGLAGGAVLAFFGPYVAAALVGVPAAAGYVLGRWLS